MSLLRVRTRTAAAFPVVAMCAVLAVGCGAEGSSSRTGPGVLVDLDSRGLESRTSLVVREDATWRARCDYPERGRLVSGTLPAARLAEWRDTIDAFDRPVMVRQQPAANDAPVTSINGQTVSDDELEDFAFGLVRFARNQCAREDARSVTSRLPGPDEPLRVEEALALGTQEVVTVRGNLLIRDGRTRLCTLLLESMPPQCGGPAVEVWGLDRAALDVQTARGVAWKQGVTLSGVIRDGVLDVSRR